MAIHTLVYLGWFDYSFHRLPEDPVHYYTKGRGRQDPQPVEESSEDIDGIKFGYMEKPGKWFLIVTVDDLILRAPFLLVSDRHGVKGPGPSECKLGDGVACNILVDAIVSNPEYRDVLGARIRSIGQD
jgi:hypothetical protein